MCESKNCGVPDIDRYYGGSASNVSTDNAAVTATEDNIPD